MIKTLLDSHFDLQNWVIFITAIVILVIIDWKFFIRNGDKNIKSSLKSTRRIPIQINGN